MGMCLSECDAGDSTQRIHKSKTHPIGSGLTSRYQHGSHYELSRNEALHRVEGLMFPVPDEKFHAATEQICLTKVFSRLSETIDRLRSETSKTGRYRYASARLPGERSSV